MSYDESVDHPKPKVKSFARTKPRKQGKLGYHVCVPLYHGIPKELQTGWAKYGSHAIEAWNNTTDIEPFLRLMPHPERFDRNLYCGTCGRIMVKGRDTTQNPLPTAKLDLI